MAFGRRNDPTKGGAPHQRLGRRLRRVGVASALALAQVVLAECGPGGLAPQDASILVKVTGDPSDGLVMVNAFVEDTLPPYNKITNTVPVGGSVRFDNLGAGFDIRVGVRRLGTHRCELVSGSLSGVPLLDSTTFVRTTSGRTDSVEFRLRCASGTVDLVVSGLPPGEQTDVLVDSPLDHFPYIGRVSNGTTSVPVVPHAAVEIFPQPAHHAGTFYFAPRDTVVVRTGQTTTVPIVYAPQNGCSADQPIAWYRLDGTGADASGNGNDGTASGATPAADRHGTAGAALSFDGVDDRVDLGDRFNTLSLPFSIAAWIYQPAAAQGDFRAIFATDDETDVYAGMFFQTTPTGGGQISFGDGGPVGADHRRTLETAAPLPTDRWLHLVATVRGVADMTLYVNGVPVSEIMSGTGGPPAHSAAPARIGAFQLVAANRPWLGLLDELRIYDCSLDAGEVSVLYAMP